MILSTCNFEYHMLYKLKYENDIFILCETIPMILFILFAFPNVFFHQSRPLKLINTMLKSFRFCNVYLQYGIVIQGFLR